MADENVPFIRRVVIENYKSIRHCDVRLGPMTFLVGPNGSGKSNFLDALEFVRDSQLHALSEVIRMRSGGLREICHQSAEKASSFSIKLELAIPTKGAAPGTPSHRDATYEFSIAKDSPGKFRVERERCEVSPDVGYAVEDGQLVRTPTGENGSDCRSIPTDRLLLNSALQSPVFVALSDLLARISPYAINHDEVRDMATFGSGSESISLQSDGAKVGSVFQTMAEPARQRVEEYMRVILPTIEHIKIESFNDFAWRRISSKFPDCSREILDEVCGPTPNPMFLSFVLRSAVESMHFPHTAMSDGTLRAFAVLVALFQCADQPSETRIPLVSIEEPEATVHPAAAGVLFDALHEASGFTQVIATSHSAELLDRKDLDPDSLLVVDAPEGETLIGPADAASMSLLRDQLCTAGELMRQNQLKPDVGHGASTVESG